MSPPILLTTTGTLSPVPLADLGKIPGFTHPTTNYDITDEFRLSAIAFSTDLQDAINNGYIILEDQYGLPITNVSEQVNSSLGIMDEGAPVADYAAILDFYGTSLVTGPTGGIIQIVGLQGDQGPQGSIGSQGQDGFQGFQGFQGNTGIDGLQGFQGDIGFQGPQGFQGTSEGSESFLLNGTFNGSTNNDRYLNGPDGVSLELAPLVLPFDAELTAMSATSEQGAGTAVWNAQLYVNGALATNASLSLNNVDKVFQDGFPTVSSFSAGDELALYVDRISSGVRKPRINAWFRRLSS